MNRETKSRLKTVGIVLGVILFMVWGFTQINNADYYHNHKRASLYYPQRMLTFEEFKVKFESEDWTGYKAGWKFVWGVPVLTSCGEDNLFITRRRNFLYGSAIQFDYINYRMSYKDYIKTVRYMKERF